MSDIDPVGVMAVHAGHGRMNGKGTCSWVRREDEHCDAYLLAEALAASEAKVAHAHDPACADLNCRIGDAEYTNGRADGWDEGVGIALNYAIRNEDGVTLRLEHLDGSPWENPYRQPVQQQKGRAAMKLVDFLLQRIAEDEAAAREAGSSRWAVQDRSNTGHGTDMAALIEPSDVPDRGWYNVLSDFPASGPEIRHIARHDPARVLAECEAKRRIVNDRSLRVFNNPAALSIMGHRLLCALAMPYAEHSDFDPEWRL